MPFINQIVILLFQLTTLPSSICKILFPDFNEGFGKNTGIMVATQQFYGLLVKKAVHTWRSRITVIIQLIVPVLLTIFGLLADQAISNLAYHTDPPLALNLKPYPNSVTTITPGPNPRNDAENLTQAFSQWYGRRGLDVIEYNPKWPKTFELNKFWLDKIEELGQRTFRSRYVIGIGVDGSDIISYFNGETIHSAGISMANTMNFLLKFYCGDSKNIHTINEPLPKPENLRYSSRSTGLVMFKGLSLAQCLLFGLSCLVASFSVFHIREKSSGAKHLQKVSGVSSRVFWMANLTWDMLHYLVPIFIILICFAAFDIPAYVEEDRLGLVFLCFLMFGLASISSMYLMHFIFRSPAGGTVAIIIINTVAGKKGLSGQK